MTVNFNDRQFKSLNNSGNGEVSNDTTFHYRQNENIISASYQGGRILQGQLIGKVFPDNHLEFVYQHINLEKEIMTGKCTSYPEFNDSGKIILREFWQWTCKDKTEGQSTLIEI